MLVLHNTKYNQHRHFKKWKEKKINDHIGGTQQTNYKILFNDFNIPTFPEKKEQNFYVIENHFI